MHKSTRAGPTFSTRRRLYSLAWMVPGQKRPQDCSPPQFRANQVIQINVKLFTLRCLALSWVMEGCAWALIISFQTAWLLAGDHPDRACWRSLGPPAPLSQTDGILSQLHTIWGDMRVHRSGRSAQVSNDPPPCSYGEVVSITLFLL